MEGDFEHKWEKGKETHAQGNTGPFVGAILPHSHPGLGFGSAGAEKGKVVGEFTVTKLLRITQSCLILCDPMDCSTPGSPILHCLLEFAQTRGN